MAETMQIVAFMAPGMVMCLVLTLLCGYIGLHVVMREVIFIDIALAQIAAVGAAMALFFHLPLESFSNYLVSLGFVMAAALLMSGTRILSRLAPQEAFIGIFYAAGAAAVLLVGDRIAEPEHIKELMYGNLLLVTWPMVKKYLLIFIAVGIGYALVHKPLLEISRSTHHRPAKSLHPVLWDFVFYALLGILVTFAVRVFGVLLVFGFLIVPAVIGCLLARPFFTRLFIAWIAGAAAILAGSYFSYTRDFPTGGSIVVTLGALMLVIAVIRGVQIKLAEREESQAEKT